MELAQNVTTLDTWIAQTIRLCLKTSVQEDSPSLRPVRQELSGPRQVQILKFNPRRKDKRHEAWVSDSETQIRAIFSAECTTTFRKTHGIGFSDHNIGALIDIAELVLIFLEICQFQSRRPGLEVIGDSDPPRIEELPDVSAALNQMAAEAQSPQARANEPGHDVFATQPLFDVGSSTVTGLPAQPPVISRDNVAVANFFLKKKGDAKSGTLQRQVQSMSADVGNGTALRASERNDPLADLLLGHDPLVVPAVEAKSQAKPEGDGTSPAVALDIPVNGTPEAMELRVPSAVESQPLSGEHADGHEIADVRTGCPKISSATLEEALEGSGSLQNAPPTAILPQAQPPRKAEGLERHLWAGLKKIPKRYIDIPKSQQKLLELEHAWYCPATAGISRRPNIPADILHSLRNFHASKNEGATTPNSPVVQDARIDGISSLAAEPVAPNEENREVFYAKEPGISIDMDGERIDNPPVQFREASHSAEDSLEDEEGGSPNIASHADCNQSWPPSPSSHWARPLAHTSEKSYGSDAESESAHSDEMNMPATRPGTRPASVDHATSSRASSLGEEMELAIPHAIDDEGECSQNSAVLPIEASVSSPTMLSQSALQVQRTPYASEKSQEQGVLESVVGVRTRHTGHEESRALSSTSSPRVPCTYDNNSPSRSSNSSQAGVKSTPVGTHNTQEYADEQLPILQPAIEPSFEYIPCELPRKRRKLYGFHSDKIKSPLHQEADHDITSPRLAFKDTIEKTKVNRRAFMSRLKSAIHDSSEHSMIIGHDSRIQDATMSQPCSQTSECDMSTADRNQRYIQQSSGRKSTSDLLVYNGTGIKSCGSSCEGEDQSCRSVTDSKRGTDEATKRQVVNGSNKHDDFHRAVNDGVDERAHEDAADHDIGAQNIFDLFQMTYPSYNSSFKRFISSCVYLEYLQGIRRSPPRSQWDDFLRIQDSDYLAYINARQNHRKQCQIIGCTQCQEPMMSGIDFYNEYFEDRLYKEKIITSDSLDEALMIDEDLTLSFRKKYGQDRISFSKDHSCLRDQSAPNSTTARLLPDLPHGAFGNDTPNQFDITQDSLMDLCDTMHPPPLKKSVSSKGDETRETVGNTIFKRRFFETQSQVLRDTEQKDICINSELENHCLQSRETKLAPVSTIHRSIDTGLATSSGVRRLPLQDSSPGRENRPVSQRSRVSYPSDDEHLKPFSGSTPKNVAHMIEPQARATSVASHTSDDSITQPRLPRLPVPGVRRKESYEATRERLAKASAEKLRRRSMEIKMQRQKREERRRKASSSSASKRVVIDLVD